MKGNSFIVVVLPGLLFLPACFSLVYFLVEKAVTWAEAQSYCRANYTDLTTVNSEDQANQLLMATQRHYNDYVWIGLYDDINSWKWSLQREGFYGEGETNFVMWKNGEPNDYMGLEDCVGMDIYGWNDCNCQSLYPFVCYSACGETVASSSYVIMSEYMTWSEAQLYCRQFYIDLVSVRNNTEYEIIQSQLSQNQQVWIGLYRDSWKWSDGSPTSFQKWIPPYNSQNAYINTACVVLHKGQWEAHTCDDKLFYVCYAVPVTQQIVRVKLTKNKSSVNLEDATEAILQQFGKILKGNGLSEDKQLTWRKQLNGKVFNLDKKEVPDEMICSFE